MRDSRSAHQTSLIRYRRRSPREGSRPSESQTTCVRWRGQVCERPHDVGVGDLRTLYSPEASAEGAWQDTYIVDECHWAPGMSSLLEEPIGCLLHVENAQRSALG